MNAFSLEWCLLFVVKDFLIVLNMKSSKSVSDNYNLPKNVTVQYKRHYKSVVNS